MMDYRAYCLERAHVKRCTVKRLHFVAVGDQPHEFRGGGRGSFTTSNGIQLRRQIIDGSCPGSMAAGLVKVAIGGNLGRIKLDDVG